MHSLNEANVRQLLAEAMPSFQATHESSENLGFGYIYYGLVRVLRPREVVVVGSKKGFSVLCMALALRDNEGSNISSVSCYRTEAGAERGRLSFVDPSYSVDRDDPGHMYGIGSWDDTDQVRAWWARFGVEDFVVHHKCRSDAFFTAADTPRGLDLVLCDGDHTPEGILGDIELASERLKPDGLILVHDVHPACRLNGAAAFDGLDQRRFNKFRMPVYPGLALIQRRDGSASMPPHLDKT